MAVISTLILLASCQKGPAEESAPWSVKVSHPESVMSDSNHFYISDIGKEMEPGKHDGDGAIARVSLSGSDINPNWADVGSNKPLNAPKGMNIQDGTLYVTDIDRIVGFDTGSGKQVFELDLSSTGSQFLNDLISPAPGILLVAATDLGRVYRIDLKNKHFDPTGIENLTGVNGLTNGPKKEYLYLATHGPDSPVSGGVFRVSMKDCPSLIKTSDETCKIESLNAPAGLYDGISFYNNTLVVSDWHEFKPNMGRIRYRGDDGNWKTAPDNAFSGSADFHIHGTMLYLPEMMTGNIARLSLEDILKN